MKMFNQISFKHKIYKNYVSVIIPVFNEYIALNDTLESLEKQTLPKDKYEVIVVNDGGNKKISEVIAKYKHIEVKIVPNKGSYFARNRGLENSKGEHIAFTDADVIVPTNWLEQGIKVLKTAEYVGGPVKIDKTKINSLASYYDYYTAFPVHLYLKYHHYAPTANLFVKKTVFRVLGGFDEELWSGGDNEFGNRVYISNKFKQFYSTHIGVIHPPRGYQELIKKMKRVMNGSEILAQRHPTRFSYLHITKKNLFVRFFTPPKIYTNTNNYALILIFSLFNWWLQINFVTYYINKKYFS